MKKLTIYGMCMLVASLCALSGCKALGERDVTISEYGVFKADAVKKVGAKGTSLKHMVTLGNVT